MYVSLDMIYIYIYLFYLFPAPGCGIAIGSWMRTYRDLLGVRSLWKLLPRWSNHHNLVCHRMAFADMGLRSSGRVSPGAAPRLGTGACSCVGAVVCSQLDSCWETEALMQNSFGHEQGLIMSYGADLEAHSNSFLRPRSWDRFRSRISSFWAVF